MLKNLREKISAKVLAMSIIVAGFLPSAFAQSAGDPFDIAVAATSTKIASYGGALVGVAAVGVIFMVAMKYVKKIPRAS